MMNEAGPSEDLKMNEVEREREPYPPDDKNENGMKAADESMENDNRCPICLENWCSTANHRVCTLKCGHLFGYSCINKWFASQKSRNIKPSCPQCNKKFRRNEIIPIYTSCIKAVDNSEAERLTKLLEEEIALRMRTESELFNIRSRFNMVTAENKKLDSICEETIKKLNLLVQCKKFSDGSYCSGRSYELIRTIAIKGQDSRVLCKHPQSNVLLAAQYYEKSVFPGHGILKIDFNSTIRGDSTTQWIQVHSSSIRNLLPCPLNQNLVLSCSFDKTLKITNIHTNFNVLTYQTPGQAWSCCWDYMNSNIVYCGLNNSSVLIYDIRNTSEKLSQIHLEGYNHSSNLSPVLSLKQMAVSDDNGNVIYEGILAARNDGLFFIDTRSVEFAASQIMTSSSSIFNLSSHESRNLCLVSERPSQVCKSTEYIVGKLVERTQYPQEENKTRGNVTFQAVSEFRGGNKSTILSGSAIYTPDANSTCIAITDEETSSIRVHNIVTRSCFSVPLCSGVPINVLPITHQNCHYLAALSTDKNSTCSIYKFSP